ncbi:phage virion morphogenesis protein [Pseudoxanthomonas sp. 22568]|uniref:phage virion morphogenesis protein n=1 Tax=Pseudoxanthomonas sp. 22568 TaxID=3453945 RepID=UPI003F83874F
MEPRIDINDAAVLAELRRLDIATNGNAPRAMAAVARFMKTSTQLRFARGEAPDGSRWWPSRRAEEQGGQTLRDTNRLFRSITWRAGAAYAEVGTNVIYAKAHHYGVRKIVNVRAHRRMRRTRWEGGMSVKAVAVKSFARLMFMPRREIFGFTDNDRARILAILRQHAAPGAR